MCACTCLLLANLSLAKIRPSGSLYELSANLSRTKDQYVSSILFKQHFLGNHELKPCLEPRAKNCAGLLAYHIVAWKLAGLF